ncbi:MAG: MBL fold metallo-hydrolase [Thermodesulfobacteriota bacterium]|nr:MBL fold metallo-hydrolase [Thermodesulfobacteriota bacterium]
MGIQTVKGYIYAEIDYDGANVSCINTDKGLVLVDTPLFLKDISTWKEFILERNPKGVYYIINTDHHFDHIMGNNQLGGTVIMHQAAREEMLKEGMTLREGMAGMFPDRTQSEIDFILKEPFVPAHITFDDELLLYMGNCTLRVIHARGHTKGTLCVYVVEDKVLITGDDVVGGLHPYKGQAIFADWLETLKKLENLDIDIIIPGHGEICDKKELNRMIIYFQQMGEITKDLINKGMSRDEIVKEVHRAMINYYDIDPERKERTEAMFDEGTARLYDEITGIS